MAVSLLYFSKCGKVIAQKPTIQKNSKSSLKKLKSTTKDGIKTLYIPTTLKLSLEMPPNSTELHNSLLPKSRNLTTQEKTCERNIISTISLKSALKLFIKKTHKENSIAYAKPKNTIVITKN